MVNLNGIKNIIFDLGDVIINLDQHKTILAFQDLLGSSFAKMEKKLIANNVLEKFEIGEISADEFISFFKSYNLTLSNQEILEAWNSMLLNLPEERIKLIHQLANDYRIFLLSNTNYFHLNYIDDYVAKKFDMENMAQPFEKAYYSHEMGLRKPNPEIFKAILNENCLIPKETLFIDDSNQHIIAAKELNLRTHHLVKPETIIDLFNAN